MRKLMLLAVVGAALLACRIGGTATPAPPSATVPPATLPPVTTAPSTDTPTAAPVASCDLSVANAVIVYTRASAAADQFGTLSPGETVNPTARTADGFYGFEPGVAQAGNVGLFRLRWILKTHDVNLGAGCTSLPTAVSPIAGICYAMMMQDTPIYSSADTTSALVTTLHLNDYAMVTAHANGFYTLDLNVASPSMDSLGYMEEGLLGGFNGPCDGF